jgi:pyruvate-formate lyase-activating enzyme
VALTREGLQLQHSNLGDLGIKSAWQVGVALAAAADVPGAYIVEITDSCNLHCPTCSARSGPDQSHRALQDVLRELREVAAHVHASGGDTVMLSGGEPTIYPNIDEVVAWCGSYIPEVELILITNGVRLAAEPSLLQRWHDLAPNLSLYLQFDSLESHALVDIRGQDLVEVRRLALDVAAAAKVPTNLVVVVKPGVTDRGLGAVVEASVRCPVVTGITFQPIRAVGRTIGYNPEDVLHDVDVAKTLERDVSWVESGHFRAHPLWPGVVSMAVYDRLDLTDRSLPESWSQLSPGTRRWDTLRLQIMRYMDASTVYWHSLASAPLLTWSPDGFVPIDWTYLHGTVGVPVALTVGRREVS